MNSYTLAAFNKQIATILSIDQKDLIPSAYKAHMLEGAMLMIEVPFVPSQFMLLSITEFDFHQNLDLLSTFVTIQQIPENFRKKYEFASISDLLSIRMTVGTPLFFFLHT